MIKPFSISKNSLGYTVLCDNKKVDFSVDLLSDGYGHIILKTLEDAFGGDTARSILDNL